MDVTKVTSHRQYHCRFYTQDMLDELQLSEGENVSVKLNRQQREIVISPVEKTIATGIDETFAEQVDDFIKKYRPALEALAK